MTRLRVIRSSNVNKTSEELAQSITVSIFQVDFPMAERITFFYFLWPRFDALPIAPAVLSYTNGLLLSFHTQRQIDILYPQESLINIVITGFSYRLFRRNFPQALHGRIKDPVPFFPAAFAAMHTI